MILIDNHSFCNNQQILGFWGGLKKDFFVQVYEKQLKTKYSPRLKSTPKRGAFGGINPLQCVCECHNTQMEFLSYRNNEHKNLSLFCPFLPLHLSAELK